LNIAVIGVGGVGGYFGGKLARANEHSTENKVFFVARGEHYREIAGNGLLLDTDKGEYICRPRVIADDIGSLPVPDAVLVCVKGYDLSEVTDSLKDKVNRGTIILPLLNGVDIYQRIKTKLNEATVLPSCVYVGTHIERPGKVTQRGGACKIHFGDDPEKKGIDDRFLRILEESGIDYNYTNDPFAEIWSKYIFIAAYGLVTANYNKTLGEILEDQDLSDEVRSIMGEIYNLAKAQSVALPKSIVEESYEKGRKFPYETKTSFQRDYEITGKKDERDLFGGTILRMGKEHNIDVRQTQRIYESLNIKKAIAP
jgi:2-dehydropantoate 2-reductase